MPALALLIVSLVWAFSFGLIKHHLPAAEVPPAFTAAARLLLAAALFAPFLARSRSGLPLRLRLAAVGAVQFGLMYALYLASFRHLPSHLVAILTALTPLWVWLLEDLLDRRLRGRFLGAALLAAAGGAACAWPRDWSALPWLGVALLQGSNLCFAAGQVLYRRIGPPATLRSEAGDTAWMYLGAAIVTVALAAPSIAPTLPILTTRHLLVLGYLGVVASAAGFFLWNWGARRVSSGALAAWNNAKIPLGLLASLLVFGESADPSRLLPGLALVGLGLALAHRARTPATTPPDRS